MAASLLRCLAESCYGVHVSDIVWHLAELVNQHCALAVTLKGSKESREKKKPTLCSTARLRWQIGCLIKYLGLCCRQLNRPAVGPALRALGRITPTLKVAGAKLTSCATGWVWDEIELISSRVDFKKIMGSYDPPPSPPPPPQEVKWVTNPQSRWKSSSSNTRVQVRGSMLMMSSC